MRARSKQANYPHLQPGPLPRVLASASPWNTEESMGRLLSSKTPSNILAEAEHSKGRSFQELCSVLQRDRAYSKLLPSNDTVNKRYPSEAGVDPQQLSPSEAVETPAHSTAPLGTLCVDPQRARALLVEVQTSRVLLLLHLTGESYHNIVLLSVAAYLN